MSKHPEPRGGKPHPEPKNKDAGDEERTISGNVHVRGEVAIEFGPKEADARNSSEEREDARQRKVWLLEIATFVVLSIYAGLTAWQSYSTQKIANLTKEQLIVSERPWVGTDLRDTVISEVVDGKPLEWHVHYKNYGNSPALHVKWHSRIWVNNVTPVKWEKVEFDIEHLDQFDNMEFTLFTGQELPNPGLSEKIAFSGLVAQLATGISQVILGGIVQYADEFGGGHTTTFCIIYNPPKNGIPPGWIGCPVKPVAD